MRDLSKAVVLPAPGEPAVVEKAAKKGEARKGEIKGRTTMEEIVSTAASRIRLIINPKQTTVFCFLIPPE